MAWSQISSSFIQYQKNAGGASASGYYLKAYAAGTTTPINLAYDSAGASTTDKVQLDSEGFAQNGSGGSTAVYVDQDYRLVLYANSTDADANTFANALQDIDDIPQPDSTLRADLLASNGTSLITHTQDSTDYNLDTFLETNSTLLNAKRPFISTQNRTIAVPADYATIQEALNQIPFILSHEYTINVSNGTYAEDLIVPLFFFERGISQSFGGNTKGKIEGLEIYGNQTTPANVSINSIFFTGGQTYRCKFEGFTITGDGPYADAGAGLEVRHGGEVVIKDVVMASTGTATRAFSAYGGIITIKEGVNLGSSVYSNGFTAKVGGQCMVASNDPSGNPNSGTVTGNLFSSQDGLISVESDRDGATPFRYAQFSTSGTDAASGGGNVVEWEGGQTALLHDVKFVNEAKIVVSDTTDVNGDITIAHGLDITPDWAIAQVISTGRTEYSCRVRSIGATNIIIYFWDGSGSALTSTAVDVALNVGLSN